MRRRGRLRKRTLPARVEIHRGAGRALDPTRAVDADGDRGAVADVPCLGAEEVHAAEGGRAAAEHTGIDAAGANGDRVGGKRIVARTGRIKRPNP